MVLLEFLYFKWPLSMPTRILIEVFDQSVTCGLTNVILLIEGFLWAVTGIFLSHRC